MTNLSKKCKLSEVYTNHSIRATGAIILAKNMYCNAQIMAVTGHKSVQALSMYQRVDDEDKIRMGKTLTDNVLKEPYKTMAAISYTTTSMGQGRPVIAGGNNSLALPSTERSNIVSTTGRQDVYLQRQQYRPPMLPYNGPLPNTSFMPKHLSTVNQGNDVRVANETLQGVDMAELFNDFTKTSVHIQNSAQCHQVFNNCSVTIVMPKL